MFKLTRNEFTNPDKRSCWYEDEYKNTCLMKRTESGITAKLRFNDKRITAPKMEIAFPPPKDEFGICLTLSCDGKEVSQEFLDNLSEDVSAGIGGFTIVLQRWIQMLYDIKFMGFNNSILLDANDGASMEDIYGEKFARISQYEELAGIIESVFQGNVTKMME